MTRLCLCLALLLGCAASTTGKTEEGAAAGPPKKERNCRWYAVTGSRIQKKVCEGDPPPHNLVSIDQKEFERMQRRVTRPSGR